ncbi:protease propeptide/inhibitor [Cyathus striatus]|nr:protease propeptide/inhibitor [Cyathus striatus]
MPNKYIVVFKDNVTQEQVKQYAKEVGEKGGKVTNEYDGTILNGFAAEISDDYLQSLQSLKDDVISYIEPDGVVTTQ